MVEYLYENKILSLTAAIVSAHVSNNDVNAAELPDLIRSVYGSLSGLGRKTGLDADVTRAVGSERPVPRSMTPSTSEMSQN